MVMFRFVNDYNQSTVALYMYDLVNRKVAKVAWSFTMPAIDTILKKLQMKSKSIHTVSFFSYWDHTSLIGQCLNIYYFSKYLYKPCKIAMCIIINAACALRNTCWMPWMLLLTYGLLTGHNEGLPCQIVYNPHSFLLQSTCKYSQFQRKKKQSKQLYHYFF